jgi:hypothetical protein
LRASPAIRVLSFWKVLFSIVLAACLTVVEGRAGHIQLFLAGNWVGWCLFDEKINTNTTSCCGRQCSRHPHRLMTTKRVVGGIFHPTSWRLSIVRQSTMQLTNNGMIQDASWVRWRSSSPPHWCSIDSSPWSPLPPNALLSNTLSSTSLRHSYPAFFVDSSQSNPSVAMSLREYADQPLPPSSSPVIIASHHRIS